MVSLTSVTAYQQEKFRLIDETDLSKIGRFVLKHHPELGGKEQEGCDVLKAYYKLCAVDPLNPHGVSGRLDPFWHAHILHSEDYMSFCDRVFGGYLHHEPLEEGDAEQLVRVGVTYQYTRELIKANGLASDYWWAEHDLVCVHYKTGDRELNAQAQSQFRADLFGGFSAFGGRYF